MTNSSWVAGLSESVQFSWAATVWTIGLSFMITHKKTGLLDIKWNIHATLQGTSSLFTYNSPWFQRLFGETIMIDPNSFLPKSRYSTSATDLIRVSNIWWRRTGSFHRVKLTLVKRMVLLMPQMWVELLHVVHELRHPMCLLLGGCQVYRKRWLTANRANA